ncbi:MAG: hypothetical protein WC527_05780 [Candidatus Margulisiibacteriota bacterium]
MRPTNLNLFTVICAASLLFVSPKGFCEEKQDSIFSFGLSSGVFQLDYTHVSASDTVSGKTIASEPTVGGVFLITAPVPILPKHLPFELAAQAGYNYNLPANNISVSYSFANVLLKNDLSIDIDGYLGAGAVYASWNQGISGGLGWQILAGAKNLDKLYAGLRYISLPGSRLTGGYQSTFLLSQLILDFQYSF